MSKKISVKVKTVLSYYIEKELISIPQYKEIAFRAVNRLLSNYETRSFEMESCVKYYIIIVLSRGAKKQTRINQGKSNPVGEPGKRDRM